MSITLFLLFFLIIGAVSASDGNVDALGSDLANDAIAQHLDAVEDNATENSISDGNKIKSENALKMGPDAPENVLKDSGTTEVNNWGELKGAINDGAVIELSGDDVYYAEGSGITIDYGTVTIDGKGHTIDAQRLNCHIFEVNDGATLTLKNLILKNALNDDDGGSIYIDQGTLTVIGCTFTNNTATTKKGGAIYNYEGALKIVNSKFEKNLNYDMAIYNEGTEDDPFRLTIINTTMVGDNVCVNLKGHERSLDDKRDIDFLTTEFNVDIQEILYNGTPVFIDVSGIDNDFTGMITVNITNTIHNTEIEIAEGKGNTTLNLDINRYTARFKNFISVDEESFESDNTKPYLEINFRIIFEGTLSALDYLIRESTGNVTLNRDYTFNTSCDAPGGIKISGRNLTINGNGHTVKADKMDDGAIFYIEDDYYKNVGSYVTIANMTLEGAHAVSASHLTIQTRMGGAINVFRSNLTVINCTFKGNEAKDGFGGAIYAYYSDLDIIDSNFINNTAANGNVLCIWRGNANIINSNVNQEDVHSEPDLDNDNRLGSISIVNDFNAALYVPNHIRDDETLFNITQPENINAVASLTINNEPKGDIQFTDGHASANLNLDIGSYVATITTPDFVYYADSARNLTCTYLSATTTSNEFTVIPRTYIVNNSNVGDIFNDNDNLSDFIKPGDILDFQGTIDKNRNLVINKPVNIISSTKNAVINLHTVIGDTGENSLPKFSFIINDGASGSNISDLYINNTQTWIYNVDGLYLKNITINVRTASGLGNKIGHTAIRFGNHITFDNCSIFTENTEAPCLVVYVTSNFTFINSKIEGQSKVVSLIDLQCPNEGEVYDAPYDNYVAICTNNTIKNSVIKTGYADTVPIKIGENADHTTIDGIKVYASKNINPGQYATVMNSNFYNASGIELASNSVAYNNTVDGSSSNIQNGAIAYNNTFNSVSIGKGVFENNTVRNKLTISSPANVNHNTIGSIELKSSSKYSNITNNTISGTVTVNDVDVTIKFNTINTENDYAVIVKREGAVVTNNVLFAKTKFGNNAVERYQDTTVVEDNTPKPTLSLLQSLINKTSSIITLGQDFGYDGDIDSEIVGGIRINKDLTIIGNGYTIDGKDQARMFQIADGANVKMENVVFINGKAQSEEYKGNSHDVGGAIAVKGHSNLTIINCSFTNNNANQNGWGGAIFITGNSTLSIITSNFTGSYAQDGGNVLYALDGNYVHIIESNVDGIDLGEIDIDDMGDYIGNYKGEMGLLAPIKIFMTPDLEANVSNFTEGDKAQINISEPFKFNGTASLNVGNKILSDIQFINGIASVQLDVTSGKVYTATITNDHAEYAKNIGLNVVKLYVPATTTTNSFKVMKKPNIQCDLHNITYNQTLTVTVSVNGTGNITVKCGDIVNASSINEKINFTFSKLDAGNYSIELNYSGDEFTIPGEAVFNFTVFKANSSLEINDVVFDYNSTGSTPFSCDNASGVRAEVVNYPNASVNVKGNAIYVSNLNAGNYTLSVTTITDNNHNNITKTANIIVNRINSTIAIPEIILNYGETRTVNVNATGANGITAKINGKDVPVNGFTIQISGLNVTTNTLAVTTMADGNHNPVTETVNIVVNKVNSSIEDINDVVLDYGESTSVNVTTGGATGIVAKIDNNLVDVNDFVIPISGLGAGNHTLSVTTVPDGNHKDVTKTAAITVNKIESNLTVDNIVFDYNSTGSTTVSFNGTSNVTAEVVNQPKAIVSVKGNNISVSGLDVGTYNLSVTTVPDANHTAVTKTAKITVNRIDSIINVNGTVVDYGESISVNVTAVGSTGITAKIDNNDVSVNDFKIPISGLSAGNHTLSVTTVPDGNYNAVTKTVTVTVNKIESNLTVGNIVFDYNSTGSATVSFDGASNVTAEVVDQPKAIVSVKGNNISVSGLDAGTYNLSVTTVPDANHTAVTRTVKITVNKIDSIIKVNGTVLDYGESTSVNVTVDGALGITAKIDNASIVVSGFSVPISGLGAGNHTLSVTTVTDGNHTAVTKTVTVTVNKIESNLTVDNLSFDYNSTGSTAVSFNGASNVTAEVVDQPNAVVNVNGNIITVSGLNASTYTLSVTTIPDENHRVVNKNVTITVNKIDSIINADNVVLDYGESTSVNVTTGGSLGITAKIDGETIIFNGYGVPIPILNAGTHNLTVTTIPDDNHKAVTKTVTITVNKIDSSLTVGNVVLDYGNSTSVDVASEGATGITAKIDNNDVSVDGFRISISGLSVGNHTLSVTSVPDGNHKAVTKTVTITVNKVSSSLTVGDIVVDYGKSTIVNVTVVGATGITAKIDNNDVSVNGFSVSISGLSAGNHTLTVTSVPDGNHDPVTETVTITVNKVSSSLTVGDVVVDYGKSTSVNVTVEGATAISAKIDNNDVGVDGFKIPISGLGAGNHTLSVTTVPDANHTSVTKTATITVNKIDSSVNVGNVVLDYGNSTVVNVTVDGATGISAKIDNNDVSVDGFKIPISGLSAGNHILSVTTVPDGNHTAVTKTATITVNKADSPLIVDDVVLDYGKSTVVNVTAEGATAISAKIDNKDVSVNGFKIPISGLSAGTHTLSVTAVFDGNHNAVTKSAIITVNKVDSSVNVGDVVVDYGKSAVVNVTAEGATGISAKIDNKDVSVSGLSVPISGLDAGTYVLSVTTIPDANHNAVTRNASIKVSKVASEVKIDVKADNKVGDSFDIVITNSTSAFVTINNAVYDIKNGRVDIDTTALKAGTYEVIANITESTNYGASSAKATFTVSKLDAPEIVIGVEKSVDGGDLIVSVAVGDATGTVSINGEEKQLQNGKANATIKHDGIGDLTINVTYSGDDRYLSSSASAKVNGNGKKYANLVVDASDISVGEIAVINIKIDRDATGKLTVNGTEVTATDGIATYNVSNLTSGNYSYVVRFAGDDRFNASEKTITINVNKIEMPEDENPFNVDENTTVVSKVPTYSISLPSDATGNLTVIVGDKRYVAPVVNGSATVKVTYASAGKHKVTVIYSGDSKYAPIVQNTTAQVVVDPKVVMKQSSALYTGTYSVVAYGDDGKVAKNARVVFYVNGKKVAKTRTNSKGIATFTMPSKYLPNKKYTISVTLWGYAASKKVYVKSILAIKTVKVKKSAKKLVLTATLKKDNGKYLEGKQMTFKLNGILIKTVKTNKYGVAQVKIKPYILKSLKVGKKVTYQAIYAKTTAIKIAIVKR